MTLLQDMRSLFRRRSRTETMALDLAGTQAEGLSTIDTSEEDPMVNDRLIETKPSRSMPVAEPSGRVDDVMGLVRRIGDHLDGQTERTERMVTLMDRLPQALDAFPEINRQSSRMLEVLHEHFAQAKGREEALNGMLTRLCEASGRQTDVLGLIQRHVESNCETSYELNETMGTLRGAIDGLADSNKHSTDVLKTMAESTSRREAELTTTLVRTQRWVIGAVICCGTASLAAVAIGVIAFLG